MLTLEYNGDLHANCSLETLAKRGVPQAAIDVALNEERRKAINAERDKRLALGTTINVTGIAAPVPVTGTQVDQTNLLGLYEQAKLLKEAESNETVSFIAADNITHALTADQMIELWVSGSQWVSRIYLIARALKDTDPVTDNPADESLWA